jgi:hypothetical protein
VTGAALHAALWVEGITLGKTSPHPHPEGVLATPSEHFPAVDHRAVVTRETHELLGRLASGDDPRGLGEKLKRLAIP